MTGSYCLLLVRFASPSYHSSEPGFTTINNYQPSLISVEIDGCSWPFSTVLETVLTMVLQPQLLLILASVCLFFQQFKKPSTSGNTNQFSNGLQIRNGFHSHIVSMIQQQLKTSHSPIMCWCLAFIMTSSYSPMINRVNDWSLHTINQSNGPRSHDANMMNITRSSIINHKSST